MRLFWSKSKGFLESIPKEIVKKLKKDYMLVRRPPRWLKWVFLVMILLSFVGAGGAYWYTYRYKGCFFNIGCLTDDLGHPIDLDKLARSDFKRASYIYASDGQIIGMYFDEIRDPVRINEVPKNIQDAFIAAEDKRFYKHSGIDITAIISAAMGNVTHNLGFKFWTRSGGASTITQQFARLEYAPDVSDFKNRSHTLSRKIKEARLAIQLERKYPKEKILEGYLNIIWLGHGANGVASGAQRYWGKDIRKTQLSTREAAILAGLNKNPAVYDPIYHKPVESKLEGSVSSGEAVKLKEEYESKLAKEFVRLAIAKDRYNFVLEQMRDNKTISEKEYEDSKFQKDENPNTELASLRPWKNPAYAYSNRMVKEFLLSQGHTEQELSYYGGLRIYTTIDPKIQKIASEEFEKHLAFINKEKDPDDRLNGAFAIIEVKTGNILALSGGNNFDESQYNRVMASRSPGSGFKPFTYAAALESGKNYYDKVCNCTFTMRGANGKPWSPKNFKDKNPQPMGYIDLARGVIWSLNLLTLNLARSIGMEPVIQTANSMGVYGNPGMVRDSDGNIWFRRPGYEVRGGLDPGLPTAIGASGVNLIELADAYTVFYRNGKYIHPTLIKEIRGVYGDLILKNQTPEEKQVLSEETSMKMLGLMRAVTKIGTAKISMRDINQQVACKTGTSNGPKDVSIWCGTPEIFIGIRLGHDDFSKNIELPEYMKKVSGDSTMLPTGGWIVGPMARKIIDRIYSDRSKVAFPDQVEIELNDLMQHYAGIK